MQEACQHKETQEVTKEEKGEADLRWRAADQDETTLHSVPRHEVGVRAGA